MNQVSARVISKPRRLLGELERRPRLGARNISGSWIMWLDCPDIAREARPGQFVMVRCGRESILPRPFSIHQVNDRGNVGLFFAVWEDGKGTRWLSERQKGDTVEMFGPLGNSFIISPDTRKLLLIAGGTGIAPLYFLVTQAQVRGYSVKLLRGASAELKPSGKPNSSQHYPQDLLPRGIEVETIQTSSNGKTGMVCDLLTMETIDWADQVFACGPTAMYRHMARLCRQFPGLKSAQVSLETRMGCGRGVCYGCTIKTKGGLKQVCSDGPVFELDEVVWDDPAFEI